MDRRRFLQMLGIAPLAFNAHRVYFDMGRSLWLPQTPTITSYTPPIVDLLDQLNAVTQKFIDDGLAASIFGPFEFFSDLRAWQDKPLAERLAHPGIPKLVTHNTPL